MTGASASLKVVSGKSARGAADTQTAAPNRPRITIQRNRVTLLNPDFAKLLRLVLLVNALPEGARRLYSPAPVMTIGMVEVDAPVSFSTVMANISWTRTRTRARASDGIYSGVLTSAAKAAVHSGGVTARLSRALPVLLCAKAIQIRQEVYWLNLIAS